MNIIVNNEPKQVSNDTIQNLLDELGYEQQQFAIALNEDFVPRSHYATTHLTENDRIEIVAPMQGG